MDFSPRPFVLGHRGAPRAAQDNTLEGFRIAAALGADGVECDARLTADGIAVLHHDPVVPGLGALYGIEFATLRQVHPQIPTLDETLAAVPDPGFVLNVELKNGPDEPGHDADRRIALIVSEWIRRNDVYQRVIVSSFDRTAIDITRTADPSISTGLLLDHRTALRPLLGGVAADGHQWILPHHLRLFIGADRTIRAAHDAGLRVGTWTLDSTRRAARLRDAGIDAVITNAPGAMRRRLNGSQEGGRMVA